MSNLLEIRQGTSEDIPLILDLIKQFAKFGNAIDKLTASEETLKESLFGQKAYAEVILAYLNQKPVSYALFFHNFSTLFGRPGLYLVDLFVIPEARKKGVGRSMLVYLAKLAKERNCCRFEWSVLTSNAPAITFYENIGAKPLDEWKTYRITGDALDELTENNRPQKNQL